jgi:hypothetical protein
VVANNYDSFRGSVGMLWDYERGHRCDPQGRMIRSSRATDAEDQAACVRDHERGHAYDLQLR